MWNNVKVQHTIVAPARRTTAVSSSKIPDAIIRAPTAVVTGTYIERNVRLALTCDCSVLQNKFKLQTGGQYICSAWWLLIFSVHMFWYGPLTKCRFCLHSSFRQIWVGLWGHHTVWVGVYCVNIMTMLNIRKLSFQLTPFSNISVAHTHTIFIQESSVPFIISSTILYNNVAWRNEQHSSGQYFGWM